MKRRTLFGIWRIAVFVIFILVDGCVEKIQFDIPTPESQMFLEGMISDAPGPYIVKVSLGLDLNKDSVVRMPVQKLKLKLYDDHGNTESLIETAPGDYYTGGVIRGQVGYSYHITIETPDGKIFESEPDLMKPTGEIEMIRYEFDARQKVESFGQVKNDVYNVLIDAEAVPGDNNYVRWRFRGTYKVVTSPQFYWRYALGFPRWEPWICSGVVVVPNNIIETNPPPAYTGPPLPGGLQGKLSTVFDCTCCTCYVTQFESIPQLSDGQLILGNQFRNVTVGQIPINTETFFDRYLVEVDQMSLTKSAFDFFKLIRAQKEGTSSLFQPPSGEIRGNIKPVNNNSMIVGLFWATSITTKSLFIYL
ncbi:hypothetical protein BH09BAC3_BH09BAC3_13870 [soil metagenome]